MGFMDSVSAFTKGVSAKAKGNYDVVTLNSQVSGLKREISALQAQLGEEYIKLHRDDAEEALAGFIAAIKEKENKIEELNAQIEATKEATAAVQLTAPATAASGYTGRRCSNCGAPLDADAVFCGKCGAKNEIIAPEPVIEEPVAAPEPKKCVQCGAVLEDGAMFCGVCGAKQE